MFGDVGTAEQNATLKPAEAAATERPLKVLLIEHDEAFARALSGTLDQARETVGAVVTVPALEMAIARLAQETFDVVILEFFLPDGAGLLNIALLKERAPRVPIIVVGAADDEAIAV